MDGLPVKNDGGYTLIEALVSLVMISLVTLGGLSFYRNATKFQQMAIHKQVATEIANSKLEDIRRKGYGKLPDPASSETTIEDKDINRGSHPYATQFGSNETLHRFASVIDDTTNEAKKVKVRVSWTEIGANNGNDIEVTTYVTQ